MNLKLKTGNRIVRKLLLVAIVSSSSVFASDLTQAAGRGTTGGTGSNPAPCKSPTPPPPSQACCAKSAETGICRWNNGTYDFDSITDGVETHYLELAVAAPARNC